jgi:hypothetical protein
MEGGNPLVHAADAVVDVLAVVCSIRVGRIAHFDAELIASPVVRPTRSISVNL